MKAAQGADLARLSDLIESFGQQTILVLGDFVADEFVAGEIVRVSREAPVLILRHRDTQTLPGGGGNAVNNAVALGAKALPVAAVGDDAAGEFLRDYFKSRRVDTSGLIRVRGWRTASKTRFLAGWTHTTRQQVLRVDQEPSADLPAGAAKALVRAALERLSGTAALAVSDYGYGSASPEIVRAILTQHGARKTRRKAGANGAPLRTTLDSRHRLLEFASLGLTAATPNEAEIEAAQHEEIGADLAQMNRLGRRTLSRMGLEALVVTRGRDGMVVFERGRPPRSIAVVGSDQAVDVTGAGDTVIAAFSLALASGATILEAAHLANYAAGIVVMKRGTATVSQAELAAAVSADATGATTDGAATNAPDA